MADTEHMSPAALAMWNQLIERYPELSMTSGYRSHQHNADVGGANNSEHTRGNAFDFSTSGMSDAEIQEIAAYARSIGAGGTGVYDGSMHFDVGPERYWGPDYHSGSAPDWVAEMYGATPLGQRPPSQNAPGMSPPPPDGSAPEAGLPEPMTTRPNTPGIGDSTLAALFGRQNEERAGYQAGLDAHDQGLFARGDDGSLNLFGRTLDDGQRRQFSQGLMQLGGQMMGLV